MDAPGWSTDDGPTAAGAPAPEWRNMPPPSPGPSRPRDGVSIAAFVTGLLGVLLVSLVLSVVGLVRTARGRRRGRGFAVAVLVLSVAWAAVLALVLPGLISHPAAPASSAVRVAATTPTSSPPSLSSSTSPRPSPSVRPSPRNAVPSPKPVPARKKYVEDLRTGDCMLVSKLGDSVFKIPVVPCRQAHDAEVVGIAHLAGTWHGETALEKLGNTTCDRLFERYVGVPADASDHGSSWFGPTADSWRQGDRLIVCYADDGGATRTGSVKGTDS